jgi:DNA-binding transcriptional MerR regulator
VVATLGLEVRFKSSGFSFQMKDMTIGEVARRTGLQASAIRYYEKIGLLPKTQRISGQRRYETGVLNYLEIIDVAKCAGFRMDEIRQLFHGFGKGTPAFRRSKRRIAVNVLTWRIVVRPLPLKSCGNGCVAPAGLSNAESKLRSKNQEVSMLENSKAFSGFAAPNTANVREFADAVHALR